MTPAARKALLARIKKCLALTASANEHESAAALARAQAMMAENGISADDVDLADVAEALGKGGGARRPPTWEAALSHSVGKALDCRVIYVEQTDANWRWSCRWKFVGVGASAEVAGYAWAVLYRQLKLHRAAYIAGPLRRCKPARARVRADVFCQAWAMAVYRKVAALAPQPAIVALLDRYMAAASMELTTLGTREAANKIAGKLSDDYWRGTSAGAATDLRAGLGADRPELLS